MNRIIASRRGQGLLVVLLGVVFLIGIPYLTTFADFSVNAPSYETPFTSSVIMLNVATVTAVNIELAYYTEHMLTPTPTATPVVTGTPPTPTTSPTSTSGPSPTPTVTGTPPSPTPSATPAPVSVFTLNLNPNGSSSLSLADLYNYTNRYRGAGILKSPQHLLTTVVQVPQYSQSVAAQPTSNGPYGPGASTVYLATALKSYYGMTSIIAAQNVSSAPANITLQVYEEDGDALGYSTTRYNVRPGASTYFDLSVVVTGGDFIGSAKLTATGNIFATVTELSDESTYAYSYESGTPNMVQYMPSATCNRDSGTGFDAASFIAVLNTGDEETEVLVTYSNGETDYAALKAHAKTSFPACAPYISGAVSFLGAAKVESSTTPIVAITKVEKVNEYQTAYTGVPAGDSRVALPYVRWTEDNWGEGLYRSRTYFAIQNTGTSTITDYITLKYYDSEGTLVATDLQYVTLAPNDKVNTNPGVLSDPDLDEFGYNGNKTFGGSVIIEGPSGSELAVLARVAEKIGQRCEDFEEEECVGIPIQVAEDYTGFSLTFIGTP